MPGELYHAQVVTGPLRKDGSSRGGGGAASCCVRPLRRATPQSSRTHDSRPLPSLRFRNFRECANVPPVRATVNADSWLEAWERACPDCGGPLPPLDDGDNHPYRCLEGCLNGCPICTRQGNFSVDCLHDVAGDVDGEVDGFDFPVLAERTNADGDPLDWTEEEKREALGDLYPLAEGYDEGLSRQPFGYRVFCRILDMIDTPVETVSWLSDGLCSPALTEYYSEDPDQVRSEITAILREFERRLHSLDRLEPTVPVSL
jgi:hypothetical protein